MVRRRWKFRCRQSMGFAGRLPPTARRSDALGSTQSIPESSRASAGEHRIRRRSLPAPHSFQSDSSAQSRNSCATWALLIEPDATARVMSTSACDSSTEYSLSSRNISMAANPVRLLPSTNG